MKNKICTKCHKEKPLSEFYFRKDTNSYNKICKFCKSVLQKDYYLKNKIELQKKQKIYRINNRLKINTKRKLDRKLYPWKTTFLNIKNRCTNKSHPFYYCYGGKGIKCKINEDELKQLWFRDKAYLMKQPSIDRKDNNKNYTFINCKYIELRENRNKDKRKPILQLDLNGNFIKEWKSTTEASKKLNCLRSGITNALKKLSKTSHGFIWKYKYE